MFISIYLASCLYVCVYVSKQSKLILILRINSKEKQDDRALKFHRNTESELSSFN